MQSQRRSCGHSKHINSYVQNSGAAGKQSTIAFFFFPLEKGAPGVQCFTHTPILLPALPNEGCDA